MIANSTKATPPRIATRTASCGVIVGRRSSGSWSIAHARGERAEPAGRVGAAPAAARVVGQVGATIAAHERVDRQREQRVER